MRTKQLNIQDRVPCASILIAITIIILFSCSQKAFAQQWSTSGNDISNSNSGNVGVGTTSPGVKLDILSSVSLIARFGSTAAAHSQVLIDAPAGFNSNLTLQRGGVSKWYMGNRAANDRLSFIESTGAIETLTLLQDGKVGVGTTNPGQQLSVVVNDAANNAITHVLSIGHTTSSTPVAGLGSGLTFRSKRTSDGGMGYTGYIAGVWENPTTEDGALVFATALNSAGFGTERMRITSSGNVGIGTSSPGVGGMPFSLNLTLASPAGKRPVFEFVSNLPDGVGYEAGLLDFIFNTNSAGHKRIGMISYEAEGGTANQRGGLMRLFTKANAGGLFERMRIDSSGNVGIGTVNPVFRLDVNGEINATGLRINGTPISTGPSGAVISVFGRTGAVVQQAGDYTWAQINKSTSSLADIATRSAGDLSSGTLPDARFPTTLPAVSGANLTALNASNLANGTVPIARLGSGTADSTKFLRGDNTWAVPAGTSQWTNYGTTIFYNSGNVGIGTTASPTEKLEVIGNIKVSGNIAAKYQDVAEWVDSSQELVAGTVVVLDSSRSNHVIATTQPYDSRIAGVISLQPGLTLGEEAEGRVLVATTGRVKVNVDATEGAIQIGDLLVTSNREGFAMKSLPVNVGGVRMHRPGTLIGKALEPLAKGTGEILVLLSLQ